MATRLGRKITTSGFLAVLWLVVSILASGATKFYYPTFYRKLSATHGFLAKHMADMIALNQIVDPELTTLTTLKASMEAILNDPASWPKYRGQP